VNNNTCTGQLSRSTLMAKHDITARRPPRLMAKHDITVRRSARLMAKHDITARRCPRLMAKHDNLLLEPTSATKTNVRTVNSTTQLSLCVIDSEVVLFLSESLCLYVSTE